MKFPFSATNYIYRIIFMNVLTYQYQNSNPPFISNFVFYSSRVRQLWPLAIVGVMAGRQHLVR